MHVPPTLNIDMSAQSKLFWSSYRLIGRRTAVRSHFDRFALDGIDMGTAKTDQMERLERLLSYSVTNVPWYRKTLGSMGMSPAQLSDATTFQLLPILTKADIKQDPAAFHSSDSDRRYQVGSTGGSTGVPLRYRHDAEDYERGVALLLRGWGLAGYRPGDPIDVIAGWSLVSRDQPTKQRVRDFLLNFRHHSSFGMGPDDLDRYIQKMSNRRPQFIRGYATSLYLLAAHIRDHDRPLGFRPKAVFSTAEVLTANQRQVISEVIGAPVFDQYGLNDGGISAFECTNHDGMHVDHERAILEVVDETGSRVFGRPGRIVATSLFNFAMPFIRYETGDIGTMAVNSCSCGNPKPLLRHILGRTTEVLEINGRLVGSPVLTVLMGRHDIEIYQIRQIGAQRIELSLVPGRSFTSDNEAQIRSSLISHLGPVEIEFKTVRPGDLPMGGKHRFIFRAEDPNAGATP
jgi:phenylacetate-CoA ligase